MPELPEVNTVRKGFQEAALGQEIIQVEVHDGKILRNCTAQEFIGSLLHRTFTDTYRQGKYFFGDMDNGYSVLFHLGMTGDIHYYRDPADKPKYERFALALANGLTVGFDDLRKFARILVLADRQAYIDDIGLGPDALSITQEEFQHAFDSRNTTVKAVMLNQSLIAGIGNLYADEICYQSQIHPGSRAGSLSNRQLNKLHAKTKEILDLAVEQEAYYQVYPDDWFWKWRDLSANPPGGKGQTRRGKIAGRTTYWVEGVQKMIK